MSDRNSQSGQPLAPTMTEVEKKAEEQKKREIASEASDRFDILFNRLILSQPVEASENVRGMKYKYQELYAAHVEASQAERSVKNFHNYQRRKKRWSKIKYVQRRIGELASQI
ncbi:hypothetical protein [Pseudomonas sp. TWP3-2]|uniref:hypothetical protein n=1 Tax=Pseudomonas sp. TWP3-2 TaxID=2804574 RepID=UPI003CF81C7C